MELDVTFPPSVTLVVETVNDCACTAWTNKAEISVKKILIPAKVLYSSGTGKRIQPTAYYIELMPGDAVPQRK
jgi:hypothetical protein